MLSKRELLPYELTIKKWAGIELTWQEKAALSHYHDRFAGKGWKLNVCPASEFLFRFLDDYFDLNVRELSKGGYPSVIGKNGSYEPQPGADFLGTAEFKQYCRERIQMWRDERTLC